jgi:hypothetical protein
MQWDSYLNIFFRKSILIANGETPMERKSGGV